MAETALKAMGRTALPEIPSLPNNSRVKSRNTDFETNFSSSDSGAQGASSAEEQKRLRDLAK